MNEEKTPDTRQRMKKYYPLLAIIAVVVTLIFLMVAGKKAEQTRIDKTAQLINSIVDEKISQIPAPIFPTTTPDAELRAKFDEVITVNSVDGSTTTLKNVVVLNNNLINDLINAINSGKLRLTE